MVAREMRLIAFRSGLGAATGPVRLLFHILSLGFSPWTSRHPGTTHAKKQFAYIHVDRVFYLFPEIISSSTSNKKMSIKKPKIAGTIPVIVAVFVTFTLFFIPSDYSYEPQFLLGPLTTIFLAILPLIVSVYAANAFFHFGSFRVLLLGCGTLALGWGSLIAGLIVEKSGFPNHFITIQNIGALLGGLFHFCGSIGIVDEKLKKFGMNHALGTIVASYLSIVTFLCIVAVGSLFDLTPPFFLGGQEEGPTLLRQSVLFIAIGLYAVSAIAFLRFYRVSGKDFFY